MKEVASLPRTPTMAATASDQGSNSLHLHADTELGEAAGGSTGAEVAADMELMGATNRDMFSWLLFNSENMTAPAGVGGHPSADHAHAQALATSMALDDPFRMLGPGDDTSLPLTLHPVTTSAQLIQTGALTVEMPATTPATTTAPVSMAAPTKPVQNQRGMKRPAADVAKDLHGKHLTNTEGLLRHLESANNALVQKRQAVHNTNITVPSAAMATAAKSPKTEKTPTSSSSDSNNPSNMTSLQRKLKLERNRESARECRRRKREHILGVEERCRQLERENMELRGQLKAGKEAIRQEEKEKNRVCEELEKMIQRGASEKELAEKIDNFKEQYSDYGHGRRSALSYHLHQIERLLLPTQVTKMCIWALRQDDSFWQDEEDETSLPVILAKELGLSEDQKKKIQQQRGSISLICENLKSALGLLSELKTEVTNKNSTLDMEMDKLQNILTPTQRAKFIVWVTNNQACMHLLNKLWRSVL
ncbi:bZIP transcription factor [Phytophthora infestans]|uniref:BZIP transcription factor n=1 Tax=Phytophthora infestans TaxID=4787 RepID=A0A8S9URE8_PHYIN|nr:bZIP transcription factor [Phytophthora infestans]